MCMGWLIPGLCSWQRRDRIQLKKQRLLCGTGGLCPRGRDGTAQRGPKSLPEPSCQGWLRLWVSHSPPWSTTDCWPLASLKGTPFTLPLRLLSQDLNQFLSIWAKCSSLLPSSPLQESQTHPPSTPVAHAPHPMHAANLLSLSLYSKYCSSKSFLLLPGSEMQHWPWTTLWGDRFLQLLQISGCKV